MVFCNQNRVCIEILEGVVTILILIDGFLQCKTETMYIDCTYVTILILIDGFLQYELLNYTNNLVIVTILILIDGFLQ